MGKKADYARKRVLYAKPEKYDYALVEQDAVVL